MSQEDLKTLIPTDAVTINGEPVEVRPFKFKHLPKVSALVSRYFVLFQGDVSANLPALVETAGEDLFSLIEWSTGKDRAFVEELDADAGMELLTKVIDVNLDFFARKVAPLIGELMTLPAGASASSN